MLPDERYVLCVGTKSTLILNFKIRNFIKNYIMNTQTISIDFPADILLTLNETERELKQRIKLSLAIRLYNQQKVTIGKAAQIAELSRLQFETTLSENKIPISNLDIDDVLNDIDKLK